MSSNTRSNTLPSSSHTIPSTRSRKHIRSSPSTTLLQPTSKRRKHNVKDQRRDLTRSIISNLPRDELERLLLEAALRDAEVMQEVIEANSVKRTPGLPQEERLVAPEISVDVEVGDDLVDGPEARVEEVLALEEVGDRGENMDEIKCMDADGPLQFHHVTRKQFERRKTMVMEISRHSSDQETPL